MKYLTLIRHAKAENASAAASDALRELAERGIHDARRMGEFLLQTFPLPQVVYVSSAVRARRTVEELLRGMDGSSRSRNVSLEVEDGLYLADPEELWEYAYLGLASSDEVWVCAHDPGITEAIERFSGSRIGRVPTCGVARIAYDDPAPNGRNGTLLFFDLPANHRLP
ncbi:MAG: hypothetical protein EA427_06750 [Spirochaetaceae bacterium]|nr:MAG: hypothetical protein EA427_06750 [Spirochaetaceae bacterium]